MSPSTQRTREPEFTPDRTFGIDPLGFARTHLSPAASPRSSSCRRYSSAMSSRS